MLLAAIVGFGIYTAVKSTYVSTTFGTYTYERNLIYLAPLLLAATAFWLERRRIDLDHRGAERRHDRGCVLDRVGHHR